MAFFCRYFLASGPISEGAKWGYVEIYVVMLCFLTNQGTLVGVSLIKMVVLGLCSTTMCWTNLAFDLNVNPHAGQALE